MPTFSVVGRAGTTKVFTSTTTPGVEISFPVPIKSFLIMPIGGDITFRFASTDADADAFPVADGQAFQMDLSLRYPQSTNISIVGYAMGAGVPVYVAVGY